MPVGGQLDVRTFTQSSELIEEFEADLHGANARYIYNVASAAPLYEWTAVYTPEGAGNANPGNAPSERQLGTQRWSTTSVDHVFEVPPERIQTSSSSGATYRHVLSAASDVSPWRQVEMITNPAEKSQLVMTHARWDDTSSVRILEWLELASKEPDSARCSRRG